jgi:hypothetical protein
MANLSSKFWTYTLTNGILVIDDSFTLTQVSFELVSGSANFIGSAQAGIVPSSAIALVASNPVTLSSGNPYPITGITIDATSGTVVIIGKI